MDLKSLVQTGIQKRPPRIVIHGVHGVGKSTFAAKAPDPIFLITEDGLTNIDVPHFPLAETVEEVFIFMKMVISEDHKYKTFVLDTADWLQTLIWEQVCKDHNVKSIEDCGYGKGYVFAMNYWNKFFAGLDKIRDKGMAIVILAHNEIKTFSPPDGEAYDRYQIKLHKHAATKLEEWADVVGFANFKVYADDGKAVNNNPERVLYTANRPAWRAKSRYDIPEELPMDFELFTKAIKGE